MWYPAWLPGVKCRRGTASLEYAVLAMILTAALLAGSGGLAPGMDNAFGAMAASTNGPGAMVRQGD